MRAQTAGVALVIGNSKYHWEASLPNVRRDAPDVARRFQALGLKTELVLDVGRDSMQRAIDGFLAGARATGLAAFYFAGHGATWGNNTYLVPVDADLSTPNVVGTLIGVRSIQAGMDGATNRLMVFDNCRNNPADGWRQREALSQSGLGDTNATVPRPNTLILYSTAPGRVALDGPPGENSPFAAALLRELDAPSIDLQTLPERLRRSLLIATQGRQVVWDQNSYGGPFLLKGAAGKPAGGGSAWSGDPTKIVELTNAYAFARQNGLLLPGGLIAHRSTGNSPHAAKVGAFRFEVRQGGNSTGIVPALIVVMSVEEQDSAEVVLASRFAGHASWRFMRPTLSGDSMDVSVGDFGTRFAFKWKDANSGGFTLFPGQSAGGQSALLFNARFTRLDG